MPTSKDLTDLDSQLKKTLISANSFRRGSSLDISKNLINVHKSIGTLAGHTRKLVIRINDIEKKVNNNSRKITSLKNVSKTQSERISGTNIGAKLPGSSTSKVEDSISAIAKSVNSIAEIFAGRKKLADDTAAYERKRAEQEKRGLAESKLEKVFKGIAKTAEKVIAPVKSLLDRIFDFIGTVILGRIVFKIVEWMGDKKNQSKLKSIVRFFKDWGPSLLSLYIVFGTSFGKFARGLVSLVIRSAVRLGAAVAGLAARSRIGRGGRVARLLGGRRGKVLSAGLEAGVTIAGTMALSNTLKGTEEPTQKLSGGGYVVPKLPTFSGGGFNFKGMLGGAAKGAMFGPLGMLLGGAFGGSSGLINGPGGPKDDKIPAMLSDGEFVMSAGAVQRYGVDTLEAMNAAGGGTNKPKIVSGTTYAAEGGLVGGYDSARYDFSPGFRGETSKSDVYLVRAINELIKVLKNKFPDNGGEGGTSYPGGSQPGGGSSLGNQASNVIGQVVSRGLSLASTAASTANKGINAANNAAKKAAKKAEPIISSLPARMDYGSLYLRSQLGGLGGSITESDLSKQTKEEYARAFEVAKSKSAARRAGIESQIRQYEGLLKAPNLTPQQKNEYQKQLKVNQSRLAKYKSGQIDVQYEDFKVNGKLSPAAKAAQKTLGAVWATPTKDGGIQIEKEPYDFPIVNDPLGLMFWPRLSKKQRDAWIAKQPPGSPHAKQLKQNPNAWGSQKIAEAMYSLNPFATPVETDVKIGGTPRAKGIIDKFTNMLDNPLLSMGRGFVMNQLKGKERDVVTGEAEKGSLFDKMFPTEKAKREKFLKNNPAAKLYDKPQNNTGQSYKSRFARPKNAGVKPVQPPTSPKPKVVYGPPVPSTTRNRGGQRSSTRTPNFNASNNSRPKINILGIRI